MKEYWVNVYDGWIGKPYDSALKCFVKNKGAYRSKQVLYRLHVKMKEPKPKYEFPELAELMPRVYSQAEV